MTLYITKNGQQLGPYTLSQARELVANGTLLATDWAWYEGITNWIPLQQVPGFVPGSIPESTPAFPAAVTTDASASLSTVRRPVLVWIICLLYFITIPLGLVAVCAMPWLLSFSAQMQQRATDQIQTQIDQTNDPDQKARLTQLLEQVKSSQARTTQLTNRGPLFYGLSILSMGINFFAAVLLFTLRRSALPAFITAFGFSVVGGIYNYVTMSFPHGNTPGEMVGVATGIVIAGIGWGIAVAIVFYVWSLSRKGILR
jgi:hypothetical protein